MARYRMWHGRTMLRGRRVYEAQARAADIPQENLSQAACRDIPSALPIALQLTSLFRKVSICICNTERVASTVATAGCSELSS
jgi:hypothetical protein